MNERDDRLMREIDERVRREIDHTAGVVVWFDGSDLRSFPTPGSPVDDVLSDWLARPRMYGCPHRDADVWFVLLPGSAVRCGTCMVDPLPGAAGACAVCLDPLTIWDRSLVHVLTFGVGRETHLFGRLCATCVRKADR